MIDWTDSLRKRIKSFWPFFRKKDISNLLEEREILKNALTQCRIEYGMEDAFIREALDWKPKR